MNSAPIPGNLFGRLCVYDGKKLKGVVRLAEQKRRRLVTAAISLALAVSLTACASGKSSEDSAAKAPAQAPAMADQLSRENGFAYNEVQVTSGAAAASAAEAPTDAKMASSVGSGSIGGIGPIADVGTSRKVIYKANVTMKVPDYDAAEEKLRDAVHQSGAYVLNFANTVDADEKGATYVIKVPADGFSSFIDRLRGIKKDLQLQMEGSDVTEEYVDLEARLQAKKTVEARLLAFMDKAERSADLLQFSSELAAVQEQIEQIKGRMRYLDQNVAYSTVNVRLYEGKGSLLTEGDKGRDLGGRLADAMTASAKALGAFGQALLIFAAGLLPVAAVGALVGVPVYYFVRNRRERRKAEAAARRHEWNAAVSEPSPPEEPTALPQPDIADPDKG